MKFDSGQIAYHIFHKYILLTTMNYFNRVVRFVFGTVCISCSFIQLKIDNYLLELANLNEPHMGRNKKREREKTKRRQNQVHLQ